MIKLAGYLKKFSGLGWILIMGVCLLHCVKTGVLESKYWPVVSLRHFDNQACLLGDSNQPPWDPLKRTITYSVVTGKGAEFNWQFFCWKFFPCSFGIVRHTKKAGFWLVTISLIILDSQMGDEVTTYVPVWKFYCLVEILRNVDN